MIPPMIQVLVLGTKWWHLYGQPESDALHCKYTVHLLYRGLQQQSRQSITQKDLFVILTMKTDAESYLNAMNVGESWMKRTENQVRICPSYFRTPT